MTPAERARWLERVAHAPLKGTEQLLDALDAAERERDRVQEMRRQDHAHLSVDCLSQGCKRREYDTKAHECDEALEATVARLRGALEDQIKWWDALPEIGEPRQRFHRSLAMERIDAALDPGQPPPSTEIRAATIKGGTLGTNRMLRVSVVALRDRRTYSWWDRLKWWLRRPPMAAGWSLEQCDAWIESMMNPIYTCPLCSFTARLEDWQGHDCLGEREGTG